MLFCYSRSPSPRIVLSSYALDLGAEPYAVGLLVATLYLFPIVISWPVGVFSDRIGSGRLLLAGTAFSGLGILIPYFARDLTSLYAAAALVGVSFSLYNVLLQNLVGLLSTAHNRARNFSNSSLLGASANFIGPLLGGVATDHLGNARACLVVAALSVVAAALLLVWGRVLPGGSRRSRPDTPPGPAVADGTIVRLLVASCLVQVGQDLYQFYIPIYGHAIGLSGSAIGLVLAAFAVAAFAVRFLMPRLVQALSAERVLAYSFYLAAMGFLLVPASRGAVALAAVSFVFGLGMGCGQPITTMLVFSHSAEGRSGATMGLRQSVNNVMRVCGPAVFGSIASAFGLPPVFWINALMMAAGGWVSRPRAARK
jgi:predicted MFS family arabinose efflux permease